MPRRPSPSSVDHDEARDALREGRLLALRGQPAHRHQAGRRRRARLEDQLRRQRRLPPHASGPSCMDKDEEDPVELEAKEAGLRYVSLDGNIGCLVNGAASPWRRWTSSSTTAARPANFLDVGGGATQGAGHQGLQDDPLEPQGEGHLRQHLRRHHEVRRHRRGRRRGDARARPARCRSSCGSKARTSSRARRSSPRAASRSRPPTAWPTARRRSSQRRQERAGR